MVSINFLFVSKAENKKNKNNNNNGSTFCTRILNSKWVNLSKKSLAIVSSKEIFDKAVPLFIKKWIFKKQKPFIDFMNNEWFNTHENWFEGVAYDCPSTNNALESFNLVIKKENTFRERLPARFLQVAKKSIEK